MPDMKLFAGNATPELAQRIANRLYTSLGDAAVGRFSDGEVSVQINENVRGGDIFIIQSTCAPTDDNLMELVVMVNVFCVVLRQVVSPPLSLTSVMLVRTVVFVLLVCQSPRKWWRIFCPASALTAC